MKYFLHDCNAADDEKIIELFTNFGYEGVGLFYTILEKLGTQEKPIKTQVLKNQLKVGKRLQKCWSFIEQIGLISSLNGDTFSIRMLSYTESFKKKREKISKSVSEWRENQLFEKNVMNYKTDCNENVMPLIQSNIIVSNENIEANASVDLQSTVDEKLSLDKIDFKELDKDKGSIIKFIQQRKPLFIEPYAHLWNIWAQERGKEGIKSLTDKRKAKFRSRVKEPEFDFIAILTRAAKSEMCKTKNWFGFDFIMGSKDNYMKILEGNYDDEKKIEQNGITLSPTALELKKLQASNGS